MTLDELKLNETGQIKKIDCPPEIKQRFTDLGLIAGSNISPILNSTAGKIRAYLVKGSLLAIRDNDAKNIFLNSLTLNI